jgi:hypothetical protein
MISPPPLQLPIATPQGGLTNAWLAWFDQLRNLVAASEGQEDIGPSPISALTSLSAALLAALQELQTLPRQECDVSAALQELQTLPRQELGTFSALQQANLPWTTFDTTPEHVPTDTGTAAWAGGTTLGIQMTANVLQRVGESEYVYVRASSAITKGQLCYHTGAVGASGTITAAPTPLGLVDPNQIVGVAAETIALNGFGLIQISGVLRGFNTTGSSVGETWADGDALYYNPAFVGRMTKVKPSAPNQKTYVGEVINAAVAGSGSMGIRIVPGSVLGGTDSNVEIISVAANDFLVYDGVDARWENTAPTAARDAMGLGTGNPTNGQMLIGNGTDFTTAALTAGTGIAVTNGVGSATIATNLAAGSNISITGTTTQTIAVTGLGTMAFQNTGISATITTAKLTAGGADGSMTFTNGILTAQTQAT